MPWPTRTTTITNGAWRRWPARSIASSFPPSSPARPPISCTRLGARAEAAFLRSLADLDVEAPAAEEWPRIAELVERYRDFPLGGTDASVVTLAERLDTDLVITLDRRHFGAVLPRHRQTLRLLP